MSRIDELHLEHPFAGARMLVRLLRRENFVVGRKHVSTLMKRMGVEALYRKPNTSRKHAAHKIWPYLLRSRKIERSNEVWALDTTYIPMARGFVYLTAVVEQAAACWRIEWRSRLKQNMLSPCWKKPLRNMDSPKSSIPTRAASSPARRSPTPCSEMTSCCRWTAKEAGATRLAFHTTPPCGDQRRRRDGDAGRTA